MGTDTDAKGDDYYNIFSVTGAIDSHTTSDQTNAKNTLLEAYKLYSKRIYICSYS